MLSESLHYRPTGASRMVRIFERDASGAVRQRLGSASGVDAALEYILRPDASVIATLGQLNNRLALNLIQVANTIDTNILLTRFERDDFELLTNYAEDLESARCAQPRHTSHRSRRRSDSDRRGERCPGGVSFLTPVSICQSGCYSRATAPSSSSGFIQRFTAPSRSAGSP